MKRDRRLDEGVRLLHIAEISKFHDGEHADPAVLLLDGPLRSFAHSPNQEQNWKPGRLSDNRNSIDFPDIHFCAEKRRVVSPVRKVSVLKRVVLHHAGQLADSGGLDPIMTVPCALTEQEATRAPISD